MGMMNASAANIQVLAAEIWADAKADETRAERMRRNDAFLAAVLAEYPIVCAVWLGDGRFCMYDGLGAQNQPDCALVWAEAGHIRETCESIGKGAPDRQWNPGELFSLFEATTEGESMQVYCVAGSRNDEKLLTEVMSCLVEAMEDWETQRKKLKLPPSGTVPDGA